MDAWFNRTGLLVKRFLIWPRLRGGTYHAWKAHLGGPTRHNRVQPRQCCLSAWEREATIALSADRPLGGQRDLGYMILDEAAVSQSSV